MTFEPMIVNLLQGTDSILCLASGFDNMYMYWFMVI